MFANRVIVADNWCKPITENKIGGGGGEEINYCGYIIF